MKHTFDFASIERIDRFFARIEDDSRSPLVNVEYVTDPVSGILTGEAVDNTGLSREKDGVGIF